MAKRDLTDKFRAWKLESGRKPKTLAPSDPVLGEEGIGLQATGLRQSEAPAWVETVENIKKDVELAREKMRTLEQLHKDRLKVIYNEKDEKAKDESIGIVVGAITQLLKRAENGVKRVAHIGNGEGVVLAQEERTTRLNVMRALANELQGLGRQFKQAQKDFGNKLKGQEEGGGALSVFDAATKNAPDFDTLIDQGLSGAEVQQIAALKQWDEERTKQIVQIAQSVNELAQVFKELNVLVIEQGTVMDRIDYQIEQTLVKVQGGRKYLEEGEKYSRNSRSLKCIACLLLIVIILIVILALQKSGNNNSK